MFLVPIYLVISVWANGVTCGQGAAKLKFTIDRDYWEGCETGSGRCEPLLFERTLESDSIVIVMPCGGTMTTVSLARVGLVGPLMVADVTHYDCPPSFDLTGLADGNYVATMISCALGGSVRFELRSKN